jgi:hypothetical protein
MSAIFSLSLSLSLSLFAERERERESFICSSFDLDSERLPIKPKLAKSLAAVADHLLRV